ncbi:MAG: DUF1080 domain-containing protein [Planctomycetaceae bacterium]
MLGSPRQRRHSRGPRSAGRDILPLSLCLGLLLGYVLADRAPCGAPTAKPEHLINKAAFPAKWHFVSSDKNAKPAGTWTLDVTTDKDFPILKCTGKPHGYLRTKSKYKNFTLELEWMYPSDPDCNSGILIHSTNGNKVWPASIQVQLHRPKAGSIFPLKGASTTNQVKVMGLKLDIKKWHTCKIVSNEGSITVFINGKKVGEVNGCKPSEGYICLQSEGSEIYFRKLSITPATPAKKADPNAVAPNPPSKTTIPSAEKSAPRKKPA